MWWEDRGRQIYGGETGGDSVVVGGQGGAVLWAEQQREFRIDPGFALYPQYTLSPQM